MLSIFVQKCAVFSQSSGADVNYSPGSSFSSLLTASFYNLVMDIVLFIDMNFTEIYVFKNDDILKLESFMFGTSLVDKSVGQNVYRHD